MAREAVEALISATYPPPVAKMVLEGYSKAPNADTAAYWEGILKTLAPSGSGKVEVEESGNRENGFEFEVNGNSIKIKGYWGEETSLQIPSQIQGKPVTEIGNGAFTRRKLESVTIPDGIISIGQNAFAENQLTGVVIPASVTTIGRRAFYKNKITSIDIPKSVTDIGKEAFEENPIDKTSAAAVDAHIDTRKKEGDYEFEVIRSAGGSSIRIYEYHKKTGGEVKIPAQFLGLPVTEIGNSAFYRKNICGITIPDTVTFIGDGAFLENKLTSVTIPASVTVIDKKAFYRNNLTAVAIPDNVTVIGEGAFRQNQLTSAVIGKSVKTIGSEAFYGNKLAEITIGNSVTNIGDKAFEDNELTSAVIPDSVTEIGKKAFMKNKLSNVKMGKNVDIGEEAFYGNRTVHGEYGVELSNDGRSLIINGYTGKGGDVKIPEQIQGTPISSIGYAAFEKKKLTGITFPNTVVKIGDQAFKQNELKSLSLPDCLIDIGKNAFNKAFGKGAKRDIVIPGKVKIIGEHAFSQNDLTGLTIGGSVERIARMAFMQNELTSVIIPDSVQYIEFAAFSGNQLTSITIGKGITSLNGFGGNKLSKVTIPETVTCIEKNAFEDNKFTNITIPKSVTSLSGFGRNQITSLTIPNTVKEIEEDAFLENKLTSVTIPDTVEKIGKDAFAKNKLTSLTIPAGITSVNGFRWNELTSIIIPNNITKIEKNAFSKNNLTSVTIPNSVKEIEKDAFGENDLTNITIPDSVTHLGGFAYNDIVSLTIPASVIAIGEDAFRSNDIKKLVIPENVTKIGKGAFLENELSSVTVGIDLELSTKGEISAAFDEGVKITATGTSKKKNNDGNYEIIRLVLSKKGYEAKNDSDGFDDYSDYLKTDIPLGCSRIGGPVVDLPDDIKYPEGYFFMAQINCSEIKPFDKAGLLPETGFIYFFTDHDLEDCRVFYTSKNIESLKRVTKIHEDQYFMGKLIKKYKMETENIESRYIEEEYDEDEEPEIEWDYSAGCDISKIYGIYTNCNAGEEEVLEFMKDKNKIILLQIGEDYMEEGCQSVIINKNDLEKKDFSKCTFEYGQS